MNIFYIELENVTRCETEYVCRYFDSGKMNYRDLEFRQVSKIVMSPFSIHFEVVTMYFQSVECQTLNVSTRKYHVKPETSKLPFFALRRNVRKTLLSCFNISKKTLHILCMNLKFYNT